MKWISARDATPEVEEEVLIFLANGKWPGIYISWWEGDGWANLPGVCTLHHEYKVTHWMPLPEAPEYDSPRDPQDVTQR